MNIYEILRKKRLGATLNDDEIAFFVQSVTSGETSREQAAAFLTSSCINGLSFDETAALTEAMTASGSRFNFRSLGKTIVDKHSTGGVGDKISLILTPILASIGLSVPMISGRGLGHTGGTVDKMESIIGYRTTLSDDEIYNIMDKVGAVIVAQTDNIAPADKILYSIRDVTANVESDGLITSSILSKKLAEDLDVLVLDLKIGSGAFYETLDAASNLVSYMKAVAEKVGLKFKIVPTDMNQPLGYAIGNWLEVAESLECLTGNMPADIKEVTFLLAKEILMLAGIADSYDNAEIMISNAISNGSAYSKFVEIIEAQGGDLKLSIAKYQSTPFFVVRAKKSARIVGFKSKQTAFAAMYLGTGRFHPNDVIDPSAGIKLMKKVGDKIESNEPIAVLYSQSTDKFIEAELQFWDSLILE